MPRMHANILRTHMSCCRTDVGCIEGGEACSELREDEHQTLYKCKFRHEEEVLLGMDEFRCICADDFDDTIGELPLSGFNMSIDETLIIPDGVEVRPPFGRSYDPVSSTVQPVALPKEDKMTSHDYIHKLLRVKEVGTMRSSSTECNAVEASGDLDTRLVLGGSESYRDRLPPVRMQARDASQNASHVYTSDLKRAAGDDISEISDPPAYADVDSPASSSSPPQEGATASFDDELIMPEGAAPDDATPQPQGSLISKTSMQREFSMDSNVIREEL